MRDGDAESIFFLCSKQKKGQSLVCKEFFIHFSFSAKDNGFLVRYFVP
jgi:hypothetical protein